MAQFTPSKKTVDDFNNGNEFINGYGDVAGDIINADDINNVIESTLYAQTSAESAVNTANAAKQTAQGALSQVNQVLADKTLLPDVQKNYYNLGAFDTFQSNGDGTGKDNRATQTYRFTGNETCNMNSNNSACVFEFSNLGIPEGVWGTNNLKSNILPTATNYDNDIYNGGMDKAIFWGSSTADRFVVRVASLEQTASAYKKWVSQQGLYVEYKVSPTYQYQESVIENQPIHTAPQEEEYYWHEEWKKGLNLAKNDRGHQGNTILVKSAQIGTYTLIVTNSGDGTGSGRFDLNYGGGNKSSQTFDNVITFTTTSVADINIYCNANMGTPYIMLTRDTIPYPYKPYNGKIIHEKDLSGIQLFPQDVNPAQTIGGDWLDLGTITVGTTTLHAYQKVN